MGNAVKRWPVQQSVNEIEVPRTPEDGEHRHNQKIGLGSAFLESDGQGLPRP